MLNYQSKDENNIMKNEVAMTFDPQMEQRVHNQECFTGVASTHVTQGEYEAQPAPRRILILVAM